MTMLDISFWGGKPDRTKPYASIGKPHFSSGDNIPPLAGLPTPKPATPPAPSPLSVAVAVPEPDITIEDTQPAPAISVIASDELTKGDVFKMDKVAGEFKVITTYTNPTRGKWVIAIGRSFHCSQIKTVQRINPVVLPEIVTVEPVPSTTPVAVDRTEPKCPSPLPENSGANDEKNPSPAPKLVTPVPGSQVLIVAGVDKPATQTADLQSQVKGILERMETEELPAAEVTALIQEAILFPARARIAQIYMNYAHQLTELEMSYEAR